MTDFRPSQSSREILLGSSGTLKIEQTIRQAVTDGPATMQITSSVRSTLLGPVATVQIVSAVRSTLLAPAVVTSKIAQAIRLTLFPNTRAINEQLSRLVAHSGSRQLKTPQTS